MSPIDERITVDGGRRQPLVVNLAPTGMVPTRAMSCKVPLQPCEIVREVLNAAEQGVTIAHLHARDEYDRPTHSKEVYARIIGGIRERCPDLILCVSCSGRHTQSFDERAEVLELKGDLKPDLASLTLSSLNFTRQASVNAPEVVQSLAQRMLDRGIKPEIEIFDLGMLNVLGYLRARSLIRPPIYANLLLGNIASAQADFLEIGTMISKLPRGTIWSLAGIGAAQLPVAAMAAAAAPGVPSVWKIIFGSMLSGMSWPPIPKIIERVRGLCEIVNREFMSPLQLRRLLELPHATACGDSASGYAA